MNNEPWYSVKCVFEHENLADKEGAATYEERIVVLYATSLDDAILRGEEEANAYVGRNSKDVTPVLSARTIYLPKKLLT